MNKQYVHGWSDNTENDGKFPASRRARSGNGGLARTVERIFRQKLRSRAKALFWLDDISGVSVNAKRWQEKMP
jgi:hypothetical protein